MEANFSPGGNLIPGSSYPFQTMQNTPQMHPQFYQQQTQTPTQTHQPMHESYAHQQIPPFHMAKNSSPSEEISTDPSQVEDSLHELNPNPNKSGKEASWHRMKWTGTMVKALITAVSYIDEDFTSPMLKKKGKWRLISKVLSERGGSHVSPQQCEDKFNDLNKRYKRLTDILGRGRSCKIVENPTLLDYLQDISDKLKDEAKKILGSKHLFYEEMCSYHNCNRLNLPPDPSLRKSLHLAFGERDFDEGEPSGDTNEDEEGMGNVGHEEDISLGGMNNFSDGPHFSGGEKSMVRIREEGLRIQAQMLEIERQRFKWSRFSEKKERELERMRLENGRMRMENQRLELELRKKELDLECRKRRH
ncbi:Myb/SANT-like DNA-binding domain-containing protein [Carex littledalei]|uniref:Myb/SANT-like DNA-binding domain-containing protein n=1 Tax=Carex littledalei TaxID=544730 RepID=A0A833QXQ7_9POAL|nr:Myb/SANT-like DNA-binding domain-containing protein [Carex littledalei]